MASISCATVVKLNSTTSLKPSVEAFEIVLVIAEQHVLRDQPLQSIFVKVVYYAHTL